MIIQKQKEARVLQTGETQSSTKMSLDMDSAQILMQMLSKNLYSDEVGSAIRECASNALDSHRRAGVTDPIIVGLRIGESSSWEFTVEDFGVGLNHRDVENIISKYGKSTKRESENELGMMGLGFKAPLAYCSSFYFIARKYGMERKYMMYEGEDVNTIDLIYSNPTTERDGVKIIIPIKSWDQHDFRRKIKEQLCYFKDIYFDVEGIDNNFTIHRSELYQFSEMCDKDQMHVCLDDVYYPLDFSKVGIDPISMPIGIRFSLKDGLFPTPNREALRYTAEAKDIIKKRIGQVADHFVEKYNEEIEAGDNLKALYRYFDSNERTVKHLGGTMSIRRLIKYATIKIEEPTLSSLKATGFSELFNLKAQWLERVTCKFTMKNGKLFNADKTYVSGFSPSSLLQMHSGSRKSKVYYYENKVGGIMKDYLRSLHSSDCFLVKIQDRPDGRFDPTVALGSSITSYKVLLNLSAHPTTEHSDRIEDMQLVEELMMKDWIDLDAMSVPQDFLDARKQKQLNKKVNKAGLKDGKRRKVKGEIVCKEAVNLLRYNDGRNCKFESNIYDLQKLMKSGKFFIYDTHENQLLLDPIYRHTDHAKVVIISLSPREQKMVEKLEIHNLISREQFMKGKTKPFKRMVTSAKIHTFIKKYESIFNHRDNVIKKASVDLSNQLDVLHKYRDEHYRNHGWGGGREENMYKAMYEVADKYDLYDMKVYPEFLQLQKLVTETIPWISLLMDRFHVHDSDSMQVEVLVDMLKYYKRRVNPDHYVRITEETEVLESVTEQTIEEVIIN
jgi:hypothetical protein